MRYFFAFMILALCPLFLNAQFKPVEKKELTIIVTDGTEEGRNSEIQKKGNSQNKNSKKAQGPTGYDQVGKRLGSSAPVFLDTIRPLGMSNAIQAAAFLEQPKLGKAGFLLIFCVNDAIGGQQGTYEVNGETHKGVYRLIRQKFTAEEPIPAGMAAFKLSGTFFILGVS